MNLLCPNCQKMLQVPEQYAGQLMKCPLCTGTFTVPALPQAPAPPPPPPMQSPPMPDYGSPAGQPMVHESAPKKAPAPPSGDYAHVRAYTLNPRLLPWITPLCLIGVFVLLFFTWEGMYPSGIQVVSQSGWQAAFGSYTNDTNDGKIWQDQNKEDVEYPKTVGSAFFLILFLLVLLPAMLLSLAVVLVQRRLIPVAVPPALESVWSLRGLLIAALSVAALVLLVLQLASGFPLESTSWEQAEKQAKATTTKNGKPYVDTEEGITRRKMDEGKEYGKFNLQRTNLVSLVVVLMVVACVAAVLDWWVERRGTSVPPPRLDICY